MPLTVLVCNPHLALLRFAPGSTDSRPRYGSHIINYMRLINFRASRTTLGNLRNNPASPGTHACDHSGAWFTRKPREEGLLTMTVRQLLWQFSHDSNWLFVDGYRRALNQIILSNLEAECIPMKTYGRRTYSVAYVRLLLIVRVLRHEWCLI